MTAEEQGFVARVDGVLLALEGQQPSAQRLRQFPMDTIADSVGDQLRLMHGNGAVIQDSTDLEIKHVLMTLLSRNCGAPSQRGDIT